LRIARIHNIYIFDTHINPRTETSRVAVFGLRSI
jgi:hypothetical protein